MTTRILPAALGAAAALAGRSALVRVVSMKLDRDLVRLNDGDYGPLLANYADDAVLVFNDGDHRWAGEHRGKPAIERFLQEFTAAGVRGRLSDLSISGPPWRLTLMVRFDDGVTTEDGEELYRNRVVVLARTRWGRIVRHEDFYEDTARIEELERRLTARGVPPRHRRGARAPR